ncbi:MAG TPA: PQQ-binding-like beta-propeller repeat protein [Steroidobacteraceae bacterium]|nr:PQQ-binding-like beta-propeller repeat protein [Steroidobacteraceae bacterium]
MTGAVPPRRRGVRLAAAAAVVILIIVALGLPSSRLRAEAVWLDVTGRIPDLGLGDLLAMMRPGSGELELGRLLDTHNPYAVIRVPPLNAAQKAAGRDLYGEQCASCHAPDGAGGPGAPALAGRPLSHGETPWAIYRTIRYGVTGTAMPPHPLSREQLWELVAYVSSLRLPAAGAVIPPDMTAKLETIDVPYADLAQTIHAGDDWLTYGGSYAADRFSTLSQINTQNVSRLALRWLHPFPGNERKIECSPLVRGGIMYVTGPAGEVMALDALSGTKLWEHDHPFSLIGGGEGPIGQNRGVALLGKRVFVATWDSTLSALSAATGKVLWQRRVGPYPGTWISSAPLAYRDLVVVGVATPTSTGRGYLAAYDVSTGKLRWRFMTIPGPGQPGHDTWEGASWRKGGAGPWMTGSYDPRADVLYWGVGGARPDFDASKRRGINLYSDSLVAIRGTTGQLLWYFQSTPRDTHDWDAVQVPMIADRTVDGHEEPRVLWANRNGFYYVLDRASGAFERGVPFVRENWASGLDAHGRPVLAPMRKSDQGNVVFPSARGGTNWWPPSFDPDAGLTYIPALEQGMTFFPTRATLPISELSFYTAVRAVDAYSGKLVWEHRERERTGDSTISGLLSTRGGLVFGAGDDQFFALDARSGKTLWSAGIGGTTYAAPVTFKVAGQQFVSIVIGRSLLTFALPAPAPSDGMKPAGGRSHAQANSNRPRTGAAG